MARRKPKLTPNMRKGLRRYLERETEIARAIRGGEHMRDISHRLFGKSPHFLSMAVSQSPVLRAAMADRIRAVARDRKSQGLITSPGVLRRLTGGNFYHIKAIIEEGGIALPEGGERGLGESKGRYVKREAEVVAAIGRGTLIRNMATRMFGDRDARGLITVIREHPPFAAALKARAEAIVAERKGRGEDTPATVLARRLGTSNAQATAIAGEHEINLTPVRDAHLAFIKANYGNPKKGKMGVNALMRARSLDPDTVNRMIDELGLTRFEVEPTPSKRPEVRMRVLAEVTADPHISNSELGRRVIGSTHSAATRGRIVKEAKRGLMRELERRLRAKRTWSVEELAQLSLIEGGPELGDGFAERVHRLLAIGDAGSALNPQIPNPPTLAEVDRALLEYIRMMSRTRWKGEKPRGYAELSTHDLTGAPDNYLRARFGIPPKLSKTSQPTPQQARFLALHGTDPHGAYEGMGVASKQARRELGARVASVGIIPRFVQQVRRVRGCSAKEAREIILTSLMPASKEGLMQYTTDWSRVGERKRVARLAVHSVRGDPMRVTTSHLPSGLYSWLKRVRGVSSMREGLVEWLGEAGLIDDEHRRFLLSRWKRS